MRFQMNFFLNIMQFVDDHFQFHFQIFKNPLMANQFAKNSEKRSQQKKKNFKSSHFAIAINHFQVNCFRKNQIAYLKWDFSLSHKSFQKHLKNFTFINIKLRWVKRQNSQQIYGILSNFKQDKQKL